MAFRPRVRKRISAVRRAPDGSAFEKCDECGLMVPIALIDMHECGDTKKEVKKFKGTCGYQYIAEHQTSFNDQPRSPFCFFMEDFIKNAETKSLIEVSGEGFEKWKNMSSQERRPFVTQAKMVNSAYDRTLVEEVDGICKVNDEADSAQVGKFDRFYQGYIESSDYSDHSGSYECGSESS